MGDDEEEEEEDSDDGGGPGLEALYRGEIQVRVKSNTKTKRSRRMISIGAITINARQFQLLIPGIRLLDYSTNRMNFELGQR